jgi:hypothetical protein
MHINVPAEEKKEKRKCEVEPEVCLKPGTGELSANYEVKCEGLPPIIVSTDGKAGVKIGSMEVSVSIGK